MAADREPDLGYWSPEFRAWVEAIQRDAPVWELQELDELAVDAAARLVGDRHEVNRIAALALSISIAVNERRWSAARELADELVDVADDLRDTDAPSPVPGQSRSSVAATDPGTDTPPSHATAPEGARGTSPPDEPV